MFALTIDQHDSRRNADAVPELLALVAEVDTALPFERTAGDEVQGLLSEPAAVIEVLEAASRGGHWSVGVGIGAVEQPLPGSVRESRGTALILARSAVERAKKNPAARVAVDISGGGGADASGGAGAIADTSGGAGASGGGGAAQAEALARLIALVGQRRTTGQWRVIDAVRRAPDRAHAAAALGISVQAISKSLIASGDDVVRDVYPLLARLLAEVDDAVTNAGE